jgi:hypothetical protein
MSNPCLPPETLDYTVDFLHDEPETLKRCCLVSKSWVPRARNHLFADIKFPTAKSLESWKEAFPNPSTSAACYVKTLFIDCLQVVTAADAEEGSWITGFSRVVHLEVGNGGLPLDESFSLAPFHGFSPAIKSLWVVVSALPPSRIFNLILSFPLLNGLAVIVTSDYNGSGSEENEMPATAQSSTPPTFTGSLELSLGRGMQAFAHQLLSVAGGIHFRKLALAWSHDEELFSTVALVRECSYTLESIDINCNLRGTDHLAPTSAPTTYFCS